MRQHISVNVYNIEIDDTHYSFDYEVKVSPESGKYYEKTGNYTDIHNRKDEKDKFRKCIEEGWGVRCVFNKIF